VDTTPIEELERVGLALSSQVWNLSSLAKLNAAFTREMVHGTDEIRGALASVLARLKEVSDHITRILEDANSSEEAIDSASQSFDSIENSVTGMERRFNSIRFLHREREKS
jgi:methyl-accepting chemotaxis protein